MAEPYGKKTLQFVDLGPSNVVVARQGLESRMVERNSHSTMRRQRQSSATMSCKALHVLLFHLIFWVGRAAVPLLLVLPSWGRGASLQSSLLLWLWRNFPAAFSFLLLGYAAFRFVEWCCLPSSIMKIVKIMIGEIDIVMIAHLSFF